MIVLKMQKNLDGTQKPIELDIEGEIYKYSFDSNTPKEEFFAKLEQYRNYKIHVEYYMDNNLIKETNHIIKNVRRNMAGVMELELD
jgi:hypothetical protein